jgi:tRNA(Arg) A34 adenosine deaminase TadA
MELKSNGHSPTALVSSMLFIAEHDIVPKLRQSVAEGNKAFAAAVLSQSDLAPITVSVGKVVESPLLHGETSCIRDFFADGNHPPSRDCIFFSTHEPCSLCLSGIAWTGFRVVYFLFTYEDTRDLFGVGGDIDILEEVFRVRAPCDDEESLKQRPFYNKSTGYFVAKSMWELLDEVEDEAEKEKWKREIERVRESFKEFMASTSE